MHPAQVDPRDPGMLGAIGWVCVLLCWPLGLVIGLVLLAQDRRGGPIFAASVVVGALMLWLVFWA